MQEAACPTTDGRTHRDGKAESEPGSSSTSAPFGRALSLRGLGLGFRGLTVSQQAETLVDMHPRYCTDTTPLPRKPDLVKPATGARLEKTPTTHKFMT